MKLLLAIVIILIVSVLGSRVTFLNRSLSLGFRNIMFTGTEYILIGAALGHMGLDLLDDGALKQFEPFLVLGLCWIGFLFGLQFKYRQLKTLPRLYFSVSAAQGVATFIMVAVVMYFLLRHQFNYGVSVCIMAAVALGGMACGTAQSALAIVNQNYRFKNRRLLDLMRYVSGIDGIYALVFFIVALIIFPSGEIVVFNWWASLKWLLVTAVMGVIPAFILISLCRIRFTSQEFLVFLIGTVMFCGGLSHQINYSPLISGMICGVVTANFSRHHLRALSDVMAAEKSIYIILLLLLGAGWEFRFDFTLVVAVIYIMVRIFGKVVGAFIGTRVFKPDYPVPATFGLGLISDGGISVAVLMNFKILYPEIAGPFVTIIVLSILINELFGPRLILAQFPRAERVMTGIRQAVRPRKAHPEKEAGT